MINVIRVLILTSVLLFALSFGSYTFGVAYDEHHKLNREINWVSDDLAIGHIYGKRWERIGEALFLFGLMTDIIAVIIWYRGKQKENKSILNLIKEE